ncbi:cytochrome c biogenesis protein CcdA [Propionicimonas paludicola]|uniref:Cytochrome c biogenesis protein CcdA n=1 Tax=Propionicimonas paludicola TaxID=185243 RepID=A0A2A9CU31_9ACTN|nr:cytochrome c biogenesis CcdA family protein [Propionicimonas paludicola]PFG17953.1 cytochrome c biogenesis protein CcdA [Propionicimonas paludicola]
MGDLLTTGGVLAAFFAGGVALFAPCCIVFLAPSYLAAAVKNRRWRLLPLTFLFAAGLAAVLVPITVGISLIAGAIAKYHTVLYYAGGVLMLALAAFTLSGRMWSLPSFLRTPDTARGDGASFFALGVFSGIASSCCAPVLVGVMTLSALAGSPVGGVALGLAYVFGMVFPLFVMALVWDVTGLRTKPLAAKPLRLRLGRWSLATNTVNLAVAIGFTVMGGFIIYLANTGTMSGGTEVQVDTGRALATWFTQIETLLTPVPEPVLGLGLLLLAGVFIWGALIGRRRHPRPTESEEALPDLADARSSPSKPASTSDLPLH